MAESILLKMMGVQLYSLNMGTPAFDALRKNIPASLLPLPPKKEEPLEAGPASFAGLTAGAQQAAAQKAPPKSSFGAYAGALGGLRRESQPVNFYRPPKYPFTIFKIVGPFPPCIADLYAVLRPDILFFRSSPSEIRRGDLVLVTDTRASIPVPAQYFDFRGGAKSSLRTFSGRVSSVLRRGRAGHESITSPLRQARIPHPSGKAPALPHNAPGAPRVIRLHVGRQGLLICR